MHATVGEGNGCRVGCLDAQLVLQPRDFHPWRAFFHGEGFDGSATCIFVQRCPYHHDIGTGTGGDIDFFTVQHIVVAILFCCGADIGGIGAGTRLGDRHRGPLALEAYGLLFVGNGGDRSVTQALAGQGQQQTNITPAEFLDAHHGGHIGTVAHARIFLLGLG